MTLADKQIQQILCAATTRKLLILTVNDDTALRMKKDITDYIVTHSLETALSPVRAVGWIYFMGGFEHIGIMSSTRWKRESKSKLRGAVAFGGDVYVTNKAIKDIPNIVSEPMPLTALIGGKE